MGRQNDLEGAMEGKVLVVRKVERRWFAAESLVANQCSFDPLWKFGTLGSRDILARGLISHE